MGLVPDQCDRLAAPIRSLAQQLLFVGEVRDGAVIGCSFQNLESKRVSVLRP